MICDLLDLAKLENSSFNISQSYFDMSKLVVSTFEMMSFKATQQEIELHADIDRVENLPLIS